MRTKFLFTIALAASSVVFAQKKEVKAIEKAIKSGSYGEAKTLLAPAAALESEMDDKTKEKFTLLKAQAYLGVNNKNEADLEKAAIAFSSLKGTKYDDDATQGLSSVVTSLVNGAVDDQNQENYSNAATKLEKAYDYSKKDTVYLYFAASNAINAKDYDTALKNYIQLRDLNYSGSELQYFATNADTGEEELISNKNERDLLIMSKTHINPTERLSEPKSAEITKNIALIYVSQGKNDDALNAMALARRENPNDLALLRSEADIYLKMKRMDKYEETITEVLKMDPNNAELYYNLGVGADQQGNKEKARKYYEKAIEIKGDYAAAYNNLAVLILSEERAIVDQMNSLGTSNADFKKYDELKLKREGIYKSALPYLEKALEFRSDYIAVARSLYGIYEQLGMTSKADAMKARIETLEAN
ncbi:tetratricopeptide repeat protein [Dokdonia sp. Hel_I_53]|uniref:tetratricopeptide repeat protein n=1 Tax=Dokdonia sp. Hel_I_53 TaxID=1566287 RepID=UPI00119ADB41|nr:tetratricopeptide repeat protein [Dokdonia sp. Hel_I_53]TVZ51458.1 tetratricopeptide repeat protein [Dokdonia sp. Hel_I_53]